MALPQICAHPCTDDWLPCLLPPDHPGRHNPFPIDLARAWDAGYLAALLTDDTPNPYRLRATRPTGAPVDRDA